MGGPTSLNGFLFEGSVQTRESKNARARVLFVRSSSDEFTGVGYCPDEGRTFHPLLFYRPYGSRRLTNVTTPLSQCRDAILGTCDAAVKSGGLMRQAMLNARDEKGNPTPLIAADGNVEWVIDRLNEIPWSWNRAYRVRFREALEGDPFLGLFQYIPWVPDGLMEVCQANGIEPHAEPETFLRRSPLKLTEGPWDDESTWRAGRNLYVHEREILRSLDVGLRRSGGK